MAEFFWSLTKREIALDPGYHRESDSRDVVPKLLSSRGKKSSVVWYYCNSFNNEGHLDMHKLESRIDIP